MLKFRDKRDKHHNVEIIKWVAIVMLLCSAIIGNYVYRDVTPLLRIITVVSLLVLAAGATLSTKEGKAVRVFARKACIEMRKVMWPTYQETLHTTLIVVAITVISSLVLWGLDGILVRVVSFITSMRLQNA